MAYRNRTFCVYNAIMLYKGAPGCGFKPSRYTQVLQRHLDRKSWCPCKDANWTVEKGREGQVDLRKTRYTKSSVTNTGDISAERDVNITTNNININVNVDGKILPSGSDAERAYLQQHAESIYKSILAGTQGPEADILGRFIRETWLSDVHDKLNNVCALRSDKHQYIVLQMRGDVPQIETFAGKEAPEQLLSIAEKIMHQFAVDTCGGHDASKISTRYYGQTCDTREEAEALHDLAEGRGVVCQAKVWGTGHHEGQRKDFWVNMRDRNEKPPVNPALMAEGCVVAKVQEDLKKAKVRKRMGQVVSSQLQNVDNRTDKKAKIMHSATMA